MLRSAFRSSEGIRVYLVNFQIHNFWFIENSWLSNLFVFLFKLFHVINLTLSLSLSLFRHGIYAVSFLTIYWNLEATLPRTTKFTPVFNWIFSRLTKPRSFLFLWHTAKFWGCFFIKFKKRRRKNFKVFFRFGVLFFKLGQKKDIFYHQVFGWLTTTHSLPSSSLPLVAGLLGSTAAAGMWWRRWTSSQASERAGFLCLLRSFFCLKKSCIRCCFVLGGFEKKDFYQKHGKAFHFFPCVSPPSWRSNWNLIFPIHTRIYFFFLKSILCNNEKRKNKLFNVHFFYVKFDGSKKSRGKIIWNFCVFWIFVF